MARPASGPFALALNAARERAYDGGITHDRIRGAKPRTRSTDFRRMAGRIARAIRRLGARIEGRLYGIAVDRRRKRRAFAYVAARHRRTVRAGLAHAMRRAVAAVARRAGD